MPPQRGSHHLDRVQAVAESDGTGATAAISASPISASWKRSALDFGIDPASEALPRILTTGEMADHREGAQEIIATAREELDQLSRIAWPAGYVVLMGNEQGVLIDHRLETPPSSRFGNLIGGIWSEEIEGTNGTGTCIAERRPVTIHRSEHFRFSHVASSCSAAPIFGVDDELLAVLDISSTDPFLSEKAHNLAGALVIEAADSIGERHFRQHFRHHWIVAIACPDGPVRTALIAIDKEQQIVGLDHNARRRFFACIATLPSINTGFWTLFERADALFRTRSGDADFSATLTLADGTTLVPALITPPVPSAALWRSPESAWFHCRPRRGAPANGAHVTTLRQAKGGLPPRALRRVKEYVEMHLGERLELDALAQTAGMSMYHFAREFKNSVGVPPHQFVLQRRIDLVCDLLTRTDRPIADIAVEAGFSDQSHLTRCFRQCLAVSPGAFRRAHR